MSGTDAIALTDVPYRFHEQLRSLALSFPNSQRWAERVGLSSGKHDYRLKS